MAYPLQRPLLLDRPSTASKIHDLAHTAAGENDTMLSTPSLFETTNPAVIVFGTHDGHIGQSVMPGQQLNLGQVQKLSEPDVHIVLTLASISVILFLVYLLRNSIHSLLPRYLRPFAQEDNSNVKRKKWTLWTLILGFIAITGLVLSLVPLILLPKIWVAIFEVMPWMAVVLMTALDRPVSAPGILLLQYFFMTFANVTIFSVHFLDGTLASLDTFRLVRLGLSVLGIIVIGNMPLRHPSHDSRQIGSPRQKPSHFLRSPEDNLTLFQFWTMSWVYPLAAICKRREIQVEDVWDLPFEFQHTQLYLTFRELTGSLIRNLLDANGLDLFISTVLAVMDRVLEVSIIRLTSKLYRSLDASDPNEAIYWCLVMLCLDAIKQVAKTTSGWYSRKAYERSRGETFIALFGKLLTRAVPGSDATEKGPEVEQEQESGVDEQPSRWYHKVFSRCSSRNKYKRIPSQPSAISQPASNAKVVNLVRGDTYEISQRFWEFPRLVAQPVKAGFTIYYLLDIMGQPATIGFGLMILFLTVNSLLVKRLITLERSRTSHSDKRAQAVSHFVEASRPLKLYGWTNTWKNRIMAFRNDEMYKRLQISYTQAIISTINVIGSTAYPLASICLYTLIWKNGLPNEVIWPSLQLFGLLEGTVKESFDLGSSYFKAIIPVERVNKYMEEPDRDLSQSWGTGTGHISFKNASFSWPSTDKVVLNNLNLELQQGLTVIRGKVGAGKSSLLLAALNEMELRGGDLLRPNEPISYAQQLSWLQNKPIIDNIVFNSEFEQKRYSEVIDICALLPDFARMKDGDNTRLEEGGIGLSGGQKARVALARALYARTNIVLLDDPLAALDHDTASSIVRKMRKGGETINGRTIVMVTHRDDLVLRVADKVIDMEEGCAKVLTREEIEEELKHPHHTSTEHITNDDEEAHQSNGTVSDDKDSPETIVETGNIPVSIYTKYMKAGGWHLWVLLAVFYTASRWSDISRSSLLEAWGHDTADDDIKGGFWGLPNPEVRPKPWLFVLAGLSASQVITHGIAQFLLAHICLNAAQGLFRIAVERISKATFRYHDVTPTGQLKNRLIADMNMVDGGILSPLENFVYNFIVLALSLAAITSHQPMLLIILAGVALAFVYFFRIYVPVSRSLRRMEMRYLTPIISNIGVMQDGLVTIRALRVEKHFQDKHLDAVDDFQKQDHFFWSMMYWLDYRLSMASACTRALLVLFMVWYGTPASAVGFVLTQATTAISSVQQLCERFAQLQLDAVSLERVDQLNHIPEEEKGDEEPPKDWPRLGDAITFKDVSFRYDEDLPDVLKEVSLHIPGGSTCAVLGRTGSGKSTIANVLLATQLPSSGTVRIGDVDISKVSREALRSRVTIIQQDPTLFPGTLRDNMDPESRFSDEECLKAIHRVLGTNWHLDTRVDAGGKNFSQGQRQLVSIGRAILRRSGLVIMDEATASVDRSTAGGLQKILKEELGGCTVVTIAHRLEAVQDADWCLRLEDGKVVECGPASGLGRRPTDGD